MFFFSFSFAYSAIYLTIFLIFKLNGSMFYNSWATIKHVSRLLASERIWETSTFRKSARGQHHSRSIGAVGRVSRQWLHCCTFERYLGNLESWRYVNGDDLPAEPGQRGSDVKHERRQLDPEFGFKLPHADVEQRWLRACSRRIRLGRAESHRFIKHQRHHNLQLQHKHHRNPINLLFF
jgi:hypothetical protein